MSFLLDTCVLSELVRPNPSPTVLTWVGEADEEALFLSVITIGELEKGIAKPPASAKRTRLERWLRKDLAERFGPRVLPIDVAVAAQWGALTGESEQRGQPLPVIDSLIAATSLEHDLSVVTRNSADFERCGARCINPWEW